MPDVTADHVHTTQGPCNLEHVILKVLDVDEPEVVAEVRGARHIDGEASESMAH